MDTSPYDMDDDQAFTLDAVATRFLAVYAGTPSLLSRSTLEMLFGEYTDVDTVESASGIVWALDTSTPDIVIVDGRNVPDALALVSWIRSQARLRSVQIGVIARVRHDAEDRKIEHDNFLACGADLVIDGGLNRFELLKRLILLRPDLVSRRH